MDAKRILKYLRQLSANNNREWFQAHKAEYDAILTSCRNEIMGNIDEWLRCVRSPEFLKYFGSSVASSFSAPTDVSSWDQPQGFGLERLKTCPSGFPRDWAYIDYLRQKDYCCWHQVPDDFYQGDHWLDDIIPMFRAAKPMMDMMNAVIDDYE